MNVIFLKLIIGAIILAFFGICVLIDTKNSED